MTISQLSLETSSKFNRCLRGKCAFGWEMALPEKGTKGDFLKLKTINIMYTGCVFQKLKFLQCLEQLAHACFSTLREKESLNCRCNYYGKHTLLHIYFQRGKHTKYQEEMSLRSWGAILFYLCVLFPISIFLKIVEKIKKKGKEITVLTALVTILFW